MRRSWISIFTVYAPMLGVPVLLYLYIIFNAFHLDTASNAVLYLSMLGLAVFAIVGFRDVFIDRQKPRHFLDLKEAGGRTVHKTDMDTTIHEDVKIVEMRIKRFNPQSKLLEENTYKARVDRYSSVLDTIIDIKRRQDPTIAMRYSCRMGICGSCGMVVNGKPVLACETNVFKNMKEDASISVAPMQGHPLLKDLVTDFDDFFSRHASISPHLHRTDETEKYEAKKEYMQTKDELNKFLPFSYCIMCGLCVDACPVVNINPMFIGPQALSQVQRYYADSRDQLGERRLDMVDKLTHVWDCEFAGACSVACPKGVDPAFTIQMLKTEIVRKNLTGK